MSRQVRVPIQVRRSESESSRKEREQRPAVVESGPAVIDRKLSATGERGDFAPAPEQPKAASPRAEQQENEALKDEIDMWRDRALRLQAEIENFRKRQRRLAEDRIETNRGRLLRNFLMIADDLERALRAEGGDNETLREGVEMTQRSMHQLLKQEGVEPISAEGATFDPTWHEAVGTVPQEKAGVDRDTVVDVVQSGYRLDGRLLRPARVIVAK